MATAFNSAAIMLVACLGLSACSVSEAPKNDSATDQARGNGTAMSGVTREEVRPPEENQPAIPAMTQTVIQSQPGPDGSQVDLLKVAVTGDILAVTLRCSSQERFNSESFKVKDISLIDDATSQRLGVLKDNAGDWMASNVTGDYLGTDCATRPGVIWAKFPAPPATSKTVSINFPKVGPFDGVPVAR